MTKVAITIDDQDPIFQAWVWRNDSARLFVLQPALELAMELPERPCSLGERYACRPQTCYPCLVHELQNRMRRSVT